MRANKRAANESRKDRKKNSIISVFIRGDFLTKLSFFIMGASNLFRGQIIKGLLFLFTELAYLYYMARVGVSALKGMRTLGTVQQGMVFDESQGICVVQKGDNSMLMLLAGVIAIAVNVIFLVIWKANINAAKDAEDIKKQGKKLPGFFDELAAYLDSKLYRTLMALPLTGILLFTVLPLLFMILIAFTNFDNAHQPPGKLFTWVGLDNFKALLISSEKIGRTFWGILGWTIIWAILATFLNYIFGIMLALLINRDGTRLKGMWRTIDRKSVV